MMRFVALAIAVCLACSRSAGPEPDSGRSGAGGVAGGTGGGGATPDAAVGGAGGGGAGPDAAAGGAGGGEKPASGSGGGGGAAPAAPDAGPSSGGAGGFSPDGSAVDASGDLPAAIGPAVAGNACPANVAGNPLPMNRTATLIRDGFAFLEGPVWIASQKALYFSDFSGTGTNGRIHKYVPSENRFEVFAMNVGTNGLAVDERGMIVAASHDMQRLTRFDPATGMRAPVPNSDTFLGRPFNSVNDLVVRSDGNIYFTDPTYQQGGRPGQDMTAFYRLAPDGSVTMVESVPQPNGISLSPDGRTLYVASTGGAPLRRYMVAADGRVGAEGVVVTMSGSDGMAVDCAGNLYLTTAGRVRVFSPAGQALGEITGFSTGGTTNAAFGGEVGNTLFVTAGRGLYRIELNIPGLPN